MPLPSRIRWPIVAPFRKLARNKGCLDWALPRCDVHPDFVRGGLLVEPPLVGWGLKPENHAVRSDGINNAGTVDLPVFPNLDPGSRQTGPIVDMPGKDLRRATLLRWTVAFHWHRSNHVCSLRTGRSVLVLLLSLIQVFHVVSQSPFQGDDLVTSRNLRGRAAKGVAGSWACGFDDEQAVWPRPGGWGQTS